MPCFVHFCTTETRFVDALTWVFMIIWLCQNRTLDKADRHTLVPACQNTSWGLQQTMLWIHDTMWVPWCGSQYHWMCFKYQMGSKYVSTDAHFKMFWSSMLDFAWNTSYLAPVYQTVVFLSFHRHIYILFYTLCLHYLLNKLNNLFCIIVIDFLLILAYESIKYQRGMTRGR